MSKNLPLAIVFTKGAVNEQASVVRSTMELRNRFFDFIVWFRHPSEEEWQLAQARLRTSVVSGNFRASSIKESDPDVFAESVIGFIGGLWYEDLRRVIAAATAELLNRSGS